MLSPASCLRRLPPKPVGAQPSPSLSLSLPVLPPMLWQSSALAAPCPSIPSLTSRSCVVLLWVLGDFPFQVRRQAREAYRRWQADPWQGGLQFKRVHTREPIWSVRVSLGWRAVCVRSGEVAIWFWIGSHADYDALLARL